MCLYLAARAKTLVKTSIRVIPGQGKIVELAIGPGAAYAHHDDLAVSLNDNPPGFRALISESSFDTAIRRKRLVETAVAIEAGEEKSRPARRAGGYDFTIRLKRDCEQVITDREVNSYLATIAKGGIEMSVPVIAREGRMEVWRNPALPTYNDLSIRLHRYGIRQVGGLREVGESDTAIAKSGIKIA